MAPLRARLPSQTSQPAEANLNQVSVFHNDSQAAATGSKTVSTVLPQFPRTLTVDTELKLSHDDFKQLIEEFYGNKYLCTINELKVTLAYPTPTCWLNLLPWHNLTSYMKTLNLLTDGSC